MITDELDIDKFNKMARLATQYSLLDYTCFFFKEMYGRKFAINKHHVLISDLLTRVLKGEVTKVMINIAPRYSKTELAVKNFISHGLALNPAAKFIHLSYSDDLALDNSEGVKSIIEHECYQDLFPEVQIKKGSSSKKKWYTTAGGGVYATSAAGQVTGFGAGQVDRDTNDQELTSELDSFLIDAGFNVNFGGALIIDDPIKPEDADSETRRERVNNRYDSTIKNRVNSRKTPIIIIMQRLHEHDLCGYLLENEPGEWEVLSLPCIEIDENGEEKALWEMKHTLAELKKMHDENPMVFERQYLQNPTPKGGYLYGRPWKLHYGLDSLPLLDWSIRKSYTDTADLGTDYLCSISYLETKTAMYVTDVQYTQAGMEVTEPAVAKQVLRNNEDVARVESNNGGRGFARNVETQVRLGGSKTTRVVWFHQSDNKHNRIFTNANTVQNLVVFPHDWKSLWPKFYKHVNEYMAAGDNAHDDAPDALTGMVEFFGKDQPGSNAKKLSQFLR